MRISAKYIYICPLLKSTCFGFLLEIVHRPVGPKVWLRFFHMSSCDATDLTSVPALVAHTRLAFEIVASDLPPGGPKIAMRLGGLVAGFVA